MVLGFRAFGFEADEMFTTGDVDEGVGFLDADSAVLFFSFGFPFSDGRDFLIDAINWHDETYPHLVLLLKFE